jgi:CheY-like chemotaxis protein
MGGFEATRMIRRDAPASQVVILTAYDEPLPRKSAVEVGAYAYLVKGCAPQLMRDVIVKAWEMATATLRQAQTG